MGFGGHPVPRMSVINPNIQQMDQYMGQKFEDVMNATFSQTLQAKSMAARMNAQAAHSSSSRNAEGSDSMNTGMANLSLNDQMGSPNPSTSNLSPQQGSLYNPSLVSHMNKPDIMASLLPTETPPFGNRPQPESISIPFNISPSLSGGPYSNIHDGNLNIRDRSEHRTNIDSFNEENDTIRDSYNNNSFTDFTGKHSGMFLFHDMPIIIRR